MLLYDWINANFLIVFYIKPCMHHQGINCAQKPHHSHLDKLAMQASKITTFERGGSKQNLQDENIWMAPMKILF